MLERSLKEKQIAFRLSDRLFRKLELECTRLDMNYSELLRKLIDQSVILKEEMKNY